MDEWVCKEWSNGAVEATTDFSFEQNTTYSNVQRVPEFLSPRREIWRMGRDGSFFEDDIEWVFLATDCNSDGGELNVLAIIRFLSRCWQCWWKNVTMATTISTDRTATLFMVYSCHCRMIACFVYDPIVVMPATIFLFTCSLCQEATQKSNFDSGRK